MFVLPYLQKTKQEIICDNTLPMLYMLYILLKIIIVSQHHNSTKRSIENLIKPNRTEQ